jgi:hypothetical protein
MSEPVNRTKFSPFDIAYQTAKEWTEIQLADPKHHEKLIRSLVNRGLKYKDAAQTVMHVICKRLDEVNQIDASLDIDASTSHCVALQLNGITYYFASCSIVKLLARVIDLSSNQQNATIH